MSVEPHGEPTSPPAPLTDSRSAVEAHRRLAVRLASAVERRAQQELQALTEQLQEEGLVARLEALGRVQAALDRLEDAGPPSGILQRGPAEAAAGAGLDWVLLSRVDQGALVPEALHADGDPVEAEEALARLRARPVRLDYPLIEVEILRRRLPLLVADVAADPGGRPALGPETGWIAYVAAPHRLRGDGGGLPPRRPSLWPRPAQRGSTGTPSGPSPSASAASTSVRCCCAGYGPSARGCAAWRESWADARAGELSDRAVDLGGESESPGDDRAGDRPGPGSEPQLRDLLTRREVDVLERMVKGDTNARIAKTLVVSEGTVKFHVKNILRKLHASNRAEATSRYLRLTLRRGLRRDLEQIGHHHVALVEPQVVRVGELLHPGDLLTLLEEQLVELEEGEVHHPGLEPVLGQLSRRMLLADHRQLHEVGHASRRERLGQLC